MRYTTACSNLFQHLSFNCQALAPARGTRKISFLLVSFLVLVFSPSYGQSPGLPPLWMDRDIGSVQIPGSAQYAPADDSFNISASGSNIGDNSDNQDHFHFVYETAPSYSETTGGCVITTKIEKMSGSSGWAKAGVMMRQSLDPGAMQICLVMTPLNSLNVDIRLTTGKASVGYGYEDVSTPTPTNFTPAIWIRLVRANENRFKAEVSKDNSTWTTLGTFTIPMTGTIYAGLAVTSHQANSVASGTFDRPKFTPTTTPVDFSSLPSEININGSYGNNTNAYRDPTAFYLNGIFYLFYSYTVISGSTTNWYVAYSTSTDLKTWSGPTLISAKDTALNCSSPGCIIEDLGKHQFRLCLQTYPTNKNNPPNQGYGGSACYIWTIASPDLVTWKTVQSTADMTPLDVYGPSGSPNYIIPGSKRTIDPFLIRDKDMASRWWCFYKSYNGQIQTSYSDDNLETWTPSGNPGISGENSCVLVDPDKSTGAKVYKFLFSLTSSSRPAGYAMAITQTPSLIKQNLNWNPSPFTNPPGGLFSPISTNIYPGWDWCRGGLSAGFILNLRNDPHVGKYLCFFHGASNSGSTEVNFAGNNTLGLAWTTGVLEQSPWTFSTKPNGQ